MQVDITNCTGTRNRGCEALVQCLTFGLRRQFSGQDLAINLHTNDPLYDSRAIKGIDKVYFSYPTYSPNHSTSYLLNKAIYQAARWSEKVLPSSLRGVYTHSLSAAARSDWVLPTGGDLFTSDYGHLRKQFVYCSQRSNAVLLGHTIGPFKQQDERYFRENVRCFKGISVRERESYDYLISLGLDLPVRLCADLAFMLDPANDQHSRMILANMLHEQDSPVVAISASQGIIRYADLDESNYYGVFATFIDQLHDRGRQVLLIPHVQERNPNNNDWFACNSIWQQVKDKRRCIIAAGEYSAAEYKGLIGQAECLIGTRTHPTIASLSQGIPTVGIAYSRKARSIFKDIFGDSISKELVVDATELSTEKLMSAYVFSLENKPEGHVLARMRQKAKENFTFFEEITEDVTKEPGEQLGLTPAQVSSKKAFEDLPRCGFFLVQAREGRIGESTIDEVVGRLKASGYRSDSDFQRLLLDGTAFFYVANSMTRMIRVAERERWTHVHCGYLHANPREQGGDVEAIWKAEPGIYSAIKVDEGKGGISVVSDPSKTKRVFIARLPKYIVVSDTLGMIRAVYGAQLRQNLADRSFLLTYGYFPGDRTVYEEVDCVRPGQVFDVTVDGKLDAVASADSVAASRFSASASKAEALDALYQAMAGAIRSYSQGQSTVAVMLGGFDSSLVAALLKREGLRVIGYTYRYKDGKYNQEHIDDLVAFCGIEHRWVDVTPEVIGKGLPIYAQVADFPINWLAYVIKTLAVMGEIVKDGHQAVYTGDGADALFYGYPVVARNARIYSHEVVLPRWVEKLVAEDLNWAIAEQLLGHPWRQLMRLTRNLCSPRQRRLLFYFRIMDILTIARLLGGDPEQIRRDVLAGEDEVLSKVGTDLSPLRTAYLAKTLHGLNKVKLVSSMRLGGLPIHSPFLHPSVSSLVRTFPEAFLRPAGVKSKLGDIGKHILAEMAVAKELLPQGVIFQKKMPSVMGPTDWWLEEHFSGLVGETLRRINIDPASSFVRSLVRAPWPEKIYRRHISEEYLTKYALSMLFSYASFFEQ